MDGIEGITEEKLNYQILENVDGIAVVSAILNEDNIEEGVSELKRILYD